MRRLFDGIETWSAFSEAKGYDLNGYLLRGEEGTVLIDPPEMPGADLAAVRELPAPFDILLTNKDHRRDADRLRRELGARLWIHEADLPLLGLAVEATFRGGDRLPGGLRAIHVPDNKSPGETAFFQDRHGGVLFVGDAMVGIPSGELRLMDASKYRDVARALEGLRVLLEPRYDAVLVGDGTPVRSGGREAIRRYLALT